MLLGVLAVILIAGSVALALDEGTSIAYGFLWTVDLITTLGTVSLPRDTAGRVIVVVVTLGGVGTLFYAFATVAEFFVSGQLSGMVSLRRTQRMIDSYSDHHIVCGYGRVGRQVARDLKAYGANVVVIDQNPLHRETAKGDDVAWIEGQATEDEVLARAGIERAVAVIACLDSDSDNIVIALSARELRSDILIIARASADDAEKKLLRAGADRRDLPVQDDRLGDGADGAAPAGRRCRQRRRLSSGADRGVGRLGRRRPDSRRCPRSLGDRGAAARRRPGGGPACPRGGDQRR